MYNMVTVIKKQNKNCTVYSKSCLRLDLKRSHHKKKNTNYVR